MGLLAPAWYQGPDSLPAGCVAHYTSGQALQRILADGRIKLSRSLPRDRVKLVWCSTNAIWEPAAGRAVPWNPRQPQSFEALVGHRGGLARILIDASVAPLMWQDVRHLLDPWFVQRAEAHGPQTQWFSSNKTHWRCTMNAVSRDHWFSIESWQSPRWVSVPYSWEL